MGALSLIPLTVILYFTCVSDLACRRISNRLTMVGSLLGLVCAYADGRYLAGLPKMPVNPFAIPAPNYLRHTTSLEEAVLGGCVCFALMFLLWLWGGTGGGDVKLSFVIGAFLGWRDGLSAIMWCHLIGAAVILSMLGWNFARTRVTSMISREGSVAYWRPMLSWKMLASSSAPSVAAGPITLPMAPYFVIGVVLTLFGGGLL